MLSRLIAWSVGAIAFLGGAVTLVGWLCGVKRLTDWDGDEIAMLPNTALAAVLTGAGMMVLQLVRGDEPSRWRGVVVALGTLTAVIGGLTLIENITGWDFRIDTMLVAPDWSDRASVSPGRMGPPASVTYLLLGTAIALAVGPIGGRARRIAAILAVVATLPPVVAWTAYFYGADPLYSVPRLTGAARQTAAILTGVAVGLVLILHDHGLGALLRRNDPAGTLVRRFLPVSIVLLLLTGWLEDLGEKHGLYQPAFGNAALTVVRIYMFTALLWWTARAVVIQIQRQQTLESALVESQARFRTMVDVIPQLAWMARPDGWIYWFNRRWYEYTGMQPEEMEGWGWESLIDPSILPRVRSHWRAALESGGPWEDVFPLRGANGSFRWFLSRAHPIRNEQGEVLHWFGTNTDISEQRSAEESLRAANRLKDEFLATLSHELRTPMSAILGWSQMLRESAAASGAADGASEGLVEGLEIIERNARLQSRIIDDLLDMSRILSGKIRLDVQTVDLSAILDSAISAIRPAADAKGVRLLAVCDPHIRDLRGDPGRLQQVFYNLLSNAVKFTPRGGRIEVTSARVNSHVEVSVSDTGIGIKPEFLPHLFERFRQQDASTTRAFGGLGLGLSISRQLVELHGGSIHAASAGEGKGATFTVHLPVSVALTPQSVTDMHGHDRQHPTTPSAAAGRDTSFTEHELANIAALVVDDDPDAREMVRRLLERHGAKATVARSAAEALELLPHQRPDILVCDIGMPGMDGYELMRAIRKLPEERGGRTPAIALTAFARSEDRTRSMLAGFQMHLSKPVETAELLASVLSVARHRGVS